VLEVPVAARVLKFSVIAVPRLTMLTGDEVSAEIPRHNEQKIIKRDANLRIGGFYWRQHIDRVIDA
jgi:hypothetical protein